jgi:uncharacterized membrane protein
MGVLTTRLLQLHRFLNRQALYPVLLSSVLAVLLLAARIHRSHSTAFIGMSWNLFLAWIPCLASLGADYLYERYPRRWWLLILPGALWLLFYPNAPYIITDFWHLEEAYLIPVWYDIGMLAMFSVSGLLLAVISLHIMQDLVRHYVGSLLSWVFVMVVLGLSGLGIYLGRFLRWNSWDLFLHPRGVLGDVVTRLAHPLNHPQTYGVILLFGSILLVCYWAFTCRDQG